MFVNEFDGGGSSLALSCSEILQKLSTAKYNLRWIGFSSDSGQGARKPNLKQ